MQGARNKMVSYLTDEQRDWIAGEARRRACSETQVVRDLVDDARSGAGDHATDLDGRRARSGAGAHATDLDGRRRCCGNCS